MAMVTVPDGYYAQKHREIDLAVMRETSQPNKGAHHGETRRPPETTDQASPETTEMIEPALTAEQWARIPQGPLSSNARILDKGRVVTAGYRDQLASDSLSAVLDAKSAPVQVELVACGNYAGLAAYCLHDQSFGFTREDVEMHRQAATIQGELNQFHDLALLERRSLWHTSMADRIEALLPPAD